MQVQVKLSPALNAREMLLSAKKAPLFREAFYGKINYFSVFLRVNTTTPIPAAITTSRITTIET